MARRPSRSRTSPSRRPTRDCRGGGLIVGGHNYGQGSSREQAAIAPVYLGIPAVVARSFARIHRRNRICQGVLPLAFADEADWVRAEQGHLWRIRGTRKAVAEGADSLTAELEDETAIELTISLSPQEHEMLLAGLLLALIRGDSKQSETRSRAASRSGSASPHFAPPPQG